MTPERWQQLKPLLDAALEKGDLERDAFVASACGSDLSLRQELMSLLAATQVDSLAEAAAPTPTSARPFADGQLLLGRFRVVRLIGRGGMGEVYEAEDLELGRVALKTIRSNTGVGSQLLQRFRQEIQLARRVSHANVCKIYELFTLPESAGQPATAFLTMEFLEGETLADKLRAGPLPWQQAQRVALDLCAGLEAIHQTGIIHRDLKTRNIMLVEREGQPRAVLTDFGLAIQLDDGGRVQRGPETHLLAGTPEYMAPEQFEGKELTRAADIYSLGVVLFEMVSGHRLYGASTPMAAAIGRARKPALPHSPQGWREIIFRCLEFEPENRYSSAEQVASALRRAANPAWRSAHGALQFARRYRIGMAVAAVLVLVMAGIYVRRQLRLHAPGGDAKHWYAIGVNALREGTYVKATRALQAATGRDSDFAMAHARLAEAWGELDFTGNAEHEMLLAGAAAPNNKLSATDRKYLAATEATLTRDFAGAERDYADILHGLRDQDKATGYVDLGRAQEKAGEPALALASYKHAAALSPEMPAPFVHIGVLQSHLQHETDAQAAFDQAEILYRADSNSEGLAEVEFERGYLADQQGKSAEALQHLNLALTMARQIPSVQLEIRSLSWMSSASLDTNNQQAINYATQAIDLARQHSLEPWAANGLIARANAYLSNPAMYGQAEADLEQALEISRQSEQHRWEAKAGLTLASLRDQQERPQEVIPLAQQALEYDRSHGFNGNALVAGILLARAQEKTGHLDESLASANDLLKLAEQAGSQREASQLRLLIVEVLDTKNNYPAALQLARQGEKLSLENFRPLFQIDVSQEEAALGDYAKAEAALPAGLSPEIIALANSVRINMLMSQQKFAPALQLADHESGSGSGTLFEVRLAKAEADANLQRLDQATRDLAAVTPRTAAERAAWQMVRANVELRKHQSAAANKDAEAALDFYKSIDAPVSAMQAAALLAQADAAIDDSVNSNAAITFAVDKRKQVQESWTPEQYQTFAARPDIEQTLKLLQ